MPNQLLDAILNNLLVNTPRDSFVGRMATSPPPQPMQLPLGGIPPAVLGAVMSPPPMQPPMQQAQPPPMQMAQQQPTEQGTGQGTESPAKEKGKFDWGSLLKQLGIPVGAAIAGSVNPDLLPQASGLATGYAGEMGRQGESERATDAKVAEEERSDKRSIERTKAEKEIKDKPSDMDVVETSIKILQSQVGQYGQLDPAQYKERLNDIIADVKAKVGGDSVIIRSPDGVTGSIPKSELQDYINNGYSLIQ